jgi:hypothetical protein
LAFIHIPNTTKALLNNREDESACYEAALQRTGINPHLSAAATPQPAAKVEGGGAEVRREELPLGRRSARSATMREQGLERGPSLEWSEELAHKTPRMQTLRNKHMPRHKRSMRRE